MRDISTLSFKYSGKKYMFSVTLFSNTELHTMSHALNNETLDMFEYTNSANGLYLTGSIIYTDRYGIIDKYLYKQFPYCTVLFAEIDEEQDGEVITDKISDTMIFNHIFFIRNIEILNRQDNIILYKLHLVSNNWSYVIGNIAYSNYGKDKEPLLDIIKNILAYNELTVDNELFDKVKSLVKINYITNGNDNTLTAIKYLLAKQYYYDEKDDALKFLVYNELKNNYGIFDIMNKDTSKATYSVILSLFKTNQETFVQEEPINFGSITSFSKTKSFLNIFDHKIDFYDYNVNTFVDKSIKSEDIIAYQNQHFLDSNYEDRFEKIYDTTLTYKHHDTHWNNLNINNLYNNLTKILFEDNAFTINTSGILCRKPSDFIQVNLDRSLKYQENQEQEKLDDIKNKYKSFEGVWITSKVHNYIFPGVGKFRQVLTLFRNFIPKDINEDAEV